MKRSAVQKSWKNSRYVVPIAAQSATKANCQDGLSHNHHLSPLQTSSLNTLHMTQPNFEERGIPRISPIICITISVSPFRLHSSNEFLTVAPVCYAPLLAVLSRALPHVTGVLLSRHDGIFSALSSLYWELIVWSSVAKAYVMHKPEFSGERI